MLFDSHAHLNNGELLDEKNLTPYAVSKATGIPNTCLADWKSGRSKPKPEKLYILA